MKTYNDWINESYPTKINANEITRKTDEFGPSIERHKDGSITFHWHRLQTYRTREGEHHVLQGKKKANIDSLSRVTGLPKEKFKDNKTKISLYLSKDEIS